MKTLPTVNTFYVNSHFVSTARFAAGTGVYARFAAGTGAGQRIAANPV